MKNPTSDSETSEFLPQNVLWGIFILWFILLNELLFNLCNVLIVLTYVGMFGYHVVSRNFRLRCAGTTIVANRVSNR